MEILEQLKRFDSSPASLVPGTQFVHEWVSHLKQQGWEMADVSRGRPSLPTHHDAISAMQAELHAHNEHVVTYGTHALGETKYKETVATKLAEIYGLPFDPMHIAFTPGAQLGLYITFKIMHAAQPDGVFVCTSPGYLNYAEIISLVTGDAEGLHTLPVHLLRSEHFHFGPERLEEALSHNGKPIAGFVFCNPLNPTGQVFTKEEWQGFAEILKRYDAPILLDEAFAEVVFADEPHTSLLHVAPELQNRTFLFRSGTKAFGMSGERLAVNTIPEHFLEKFLFQQSRILANSPLSGQAGMAAALEHFDEPMRQKISNYYHDNAKLLISFLKQVMPEDQIIMPQGGFYLLADFSHLKGQPISNKAGLMRSHPHENIETDVDIAASFFMGHNHLENKGLATIPGSFFGTDPEQCILRLSYSISKDELSRAGEFLKQMLR